MPAQQKTTNANRKEEILNSWISAITIYVESP